MGLSVNAGNVNSAINKAFEADYRHHRDVALGTGITALLAIITAVVVSILFPPFAVAYTVLIPLAATAIAFLAPISIAFGIKAAQLQREIRIAREILPQT